MNAHIYAWRDRGRGNECTQMEPAVNIWMFACGCLCMQISHTNRCRRKLLVLLAAEEEKIVAVNCFMRLKRSNKYVHVSK